MKITSVEWERKRFRLKQKLFFDGKLCEHRDVYNFQIKTSGGISGIGEAVILESHGTESAAELEFSLNTLKKKIIGCDLSEKFFSNLSLFNSLSKTPAVRNAFEQAVLNICLQYSENLEKIFNRKLNTSLLLNDFIPALPELETLDLLREKINLGFNVFKLKTGKKNFSEIFQLLEKIKKTFPEIKLRIDPNCNWKLEEVLPLIDKFENYNIDYIEQPVSKKEDLILLQDKTKIPIAADELVTSVKEVKELISSGIKIIILKPVTIGGICNSVDCINYAEKNNARVVITSSFESNTGMQIPVIAAGLINEKENHGLNTSHFLLDNSPSSFWTIQNNLLKINI
ncbi:MAG: mandelate racemase/muconate lactonizing enzyme family protein [Rhodothermaceae bacterium]